MAVVKMGKHVGVMDAGSIAQEQACNEYGFLVHNLSACRGRHCALGWVIRDGYRINVWAGK